MPISYKANNRARKKLYDRVEVILPAGSREKLRQIADAEGITLSRWAVRAIERASGLTLELGDQPAQIAAARQRKAARGDRAAPAAQITEADADAESDTDAATAEQPGQKAAGIAEQQDA